MAPRQELLLLILCFVSCRSFRSFYFCQNLTDPNVCWDTIFPGPWLPCHNQCCSIHDNNCNSLTAPPTSAPTPNPTHEPTNIPTRSPIISTKDDTITAINTPSSYYHSSQCLYETSSSLYELSHLETNPISSPSHSYQYYSNHDSALPPRWSQTPVLFLNLCNKSSVIDTLWNTPSDGNSHSVNQYLNRSVAICNFFGDFPSDNDSAVCTEFGSFTYSSSDFHVETSTEIIQIDIGTADCLYTELLSAIPIIKRIHVHLRLICDKSYIEPVISSVTGPIFMLDSMAENHKCGSNITITMMANDGICPRHKIYGNLSWINCPVHFNQTAESINCTLHTRSHSDIGNIPSGTMRDIVDGYLRIYAFFGTKHWNISIANFEVDSNATGTFNVTLNVTEIMHKMEGEYGLTMDSWRNITIYAESVYPIGPNRSTRNVSITFKRASFVSASSVGFVGKTVGITFLCLMLLGFCHIGFRVSTDPQARSYCGYCMKCQCLQYGIESCFWGMYISCCDCRKNKILTVGMVMREENSAEQELNECTQSDLNSTKSGYTSIRYGAGDESSSSFWRFIKDKWTKKTLKEEIVSEPKVSISAESDFLCRHISSGYGAHIGIDPQRSSHMSGLSQSLQSDEEYIL